ncbi:hypothetical protein GCM10027088_49480 [Nocardia goodfellowii]
MPSRSALPISVTGICIPATRIRSAAKASGAVAIAEPRTTTTPAHAAGHINDLGDTATCRRPGVQETGTTASSAHNACA